MTLFLFLLGQNNNLRGDSSIKAVKLFSFSANFPSQIFFPINHRTSLSAAAAAVASSDVIPNVFLVGEGGGMVGLEMGHIVSKSPSGILQSCGGSMFTQAKNGRM